jgi:hypothetical protein
MRMVFIFIGRSLSGRSRLCFQVRPMSATSSLGRWAAQGTKIPTCNNAIPPMVEKRAAAGKHIMFADVTVGWNSKNMFGDDDLHPNWAGYNLMGEVWYKAVGGLFPQ